MTVRGCGRAVARDVERDAVTAGALTVVGVRVCLAVTLIVGLTVLTFRAGVPPVLDLFVVLDPLDEVERDALELDLLELDPLELDPLDEPPPRAEPPLELDPLDEPPPLERPPPLELAPLEPPAPADPVPERRATIDTPSFFL